MQMGVKNYGAFYTQGVGGKHQELESEDVALNFCSLSVSVSSTIKWRY